MAAYPEQPTEGPGVYTRPMGKKQKRSLARDFKTPLPNVWKTPRGEEDRSGPGAAARGASGYDKFEPTNQAMFDYYKARRPSNLISPFQ